jgi:hypothetical protein
MDQVHTLGDKAYEGYGVWIGLAGEHGYQLLNVSADSGLRDTADLLELTSCASAQVQPIIQRLSSRISLRYRPR